MFMLARYIPEWDMGWDLDFAWPGVLGRIILML